MMKRVRDNIKVEFEGGIGRLSNNEVKNSNVLAAKTIITYKDGVGESDTTGKVNTWKVRRYNAGSQSGGVDYSYNYNEKGNISSVTRGSYTTDYVYDVKGQLTRVNDQYADKTWKYEYDDGGNITKKKEYAYTTGSLGTALSTKNYSYSSGDWKDLLMSYDGRSFGYDPSGNMTTNGEWSFTWKHGSELDSMSNGTDTVSFLYDAEGKRISKTVNGTTVFQYDYADGRLTRIKRNNTTLHFDYDMLGPSVIRYNGVDYYYHRNAQGDIDGISNAAGELVASYRYDAWGKPLSITGTMAGTIGVLNPFRYRGYVYDEETGLYYLNTRYYDPEIGRFISPDSVSYLGADGTILGYDLYTYCDNDPVNNKDSDGNLSEAVISALIGGAFSGVFSAYSTLLQGGSIGEVFVSFGVGFASGFLSGFNFLGRIAGSLVSALYEGYTTKGTTYEKYANFLFSFASNLVVGTLFDGATGGLDIGGYAQVSLNQLTGLEEELVSTAVYTGLQSTNSEPNQIVNSPLVFSNVVTPRSYVPKKRELLGMVW